MDLGLNGRNAVVCASSQGLGRACALELARAGCTVVVNGRHAETLERTAAEIRQESGGTVIAVAADVATPEGQEALLAAVPTVDILVNNNGGPPRRDFHEIDREALLAGVVGNMAAPIELVRQVIDGMVERRFGRIVNITSASVKMPLEGLDLSSGARAGLTGFLAGVARSVAHANVTINFLLPGSFDTRRLQAGRRRRRNGWASRLKRLPPSTAPKFRPEGSANRRNSARPAPSSVQATPATSRVRAC